MTNNIAVGSAHPLGATPTGGGVNFSVYANQADAVELLLFDGATTPHPRMCFGSTRCSIAPITTGTRLSPAATGSDLRLPRHRPERARAGLRYDPDKVLLDPYGRAVAMPDCVQPRGGQPAGRQHRHGDEERRGRYSTLRLGGRSAAAPALRDDGRLRNARRRLHAPPQLGRGTEKRGTYAGLIEKIPYLQDLGITAVELLPVYHFDPTTAAAGLVNYWGYQPISFFAPHTGYSSRQDPLGVLDEFRDMVKALHRAGIEVILDVVYNHTAEGFGDGATLCFRGLANDTYYILDHADQSRYADYTGCGNTFNAGHAVVRRLIVDSLRYWVQEMHVDGFRFDLASVLTRGEDGEPLPNPPIIWDIESDPALAGTKLIAEAWDAAGLYQVGCFVGDVWKEWNGKFRDDVRSFVKSDNGYVRALADRLTGSPDVYGQQSRASPRRASTS